MSLDPFRFNPANIPADLAAIPQWLCWTLVDGDKMPFHAGIYLMGGGLVASGWKSPHPGATLEQAISARERYGPRHCGIGFVMCAKPVNGFYLYGLDFDNPSKVTEPAAQAMQARIVADLQSSFPTYFECSPSGSGLRAFIWSRYNQGARKFNANKTLGMEAARDGAWYSLTGDATVRAPIAVDGTGNVMFGFWRHTGAHEREAQDGDLPNDTDSHGRRLDLSDTAVLERLQESRPVSHALLTCAEPLSPHPSEQFGHAIGDLDKITGAPEQVQRLACHADFAFARHYSAKDLRRKFLWEMEKARLRNFAPTSSLIRAGRELQRAFKIYATAETGRPYVAARPSFAGPSEIELQALAELARARSTRSA